MKDRKAAILAEMPRLRRYARALLRDRDAADDLVQDCLERALLRLDNWQTGENPRRWLFTIMHHLFVDQMRKARRRSEVVMLTLDDSEALSSPAVQADSVASRSMVHAPASTGRSSNGSLFVRRRVMASKCASTLAAPPCAVMASRTSMCAMGRRSRRGAGSPSGHRLM